MVKPSALIKHSNNISESTATTSKTIGLSYFPWQNLPTTIIAQVGSHLFTLCLPDAMHAVHPIFHVSQLELAIANTIPNQEQPPPPPVEVDHEPEYEIIEILDSKVD